MLIKDCTYNLQRKLRYKGPMYVQELENKISLLEDESQKLKPLLSAIFPGVCMEDLEAIEALRTRVLDEKNLAPGTDVKGTAEPPSAEELLETTTEATGRLDVDGQGRYEYHGDFAGLAFLYQIGARCSQLLHANTPKPEAFPHLPLRQAFASESFSLRGSKPDSQITFQLPSRTTARRLTQIALNDASCLMTFVHIPTFNKLLDRIYSVNPRDHTRVEELFLPLLYSTLAVGELFSVGSQNQGAPMTSVTQMNGSVSLCHREKRELIRCGTE
jgi:hypothetical protein